jgi:hypothetical protein
MEILTMAQRDNGSKLTTREVTIQTIDVTIQAMRIGQKQVTLALFRQLVRDDGFLRHGALPWGWVHYYWDGCGMRFREWNDGWAKHVVWQDGELLRRAVVHYSDNNDDLNGRLYTQYWQAACALPQLYIAV